MPPIYHEVRIHVDIIGFGSEPVFSSAVTRLDAVVFVGFYSVAIKGHVGSEVLVQNWYVVSTW